MAYIKAGRGRTFTKTGLIRGREHEGRKAILASRSVNSRIAAIGPDGLTMGGSEIVWTSDILDVQMVDESEVDPEAPVTAVLADRGMLKLPPQIRRRLHLHAGSPVLITLQGDAILIQPAEIRPRGISAAPSLEAFLANVTTEDLHDPADPEACARGKVS